MAWHVGVLGSGDWSRVHLAALEQSPHVLRVTLAGRNPQTVSQLAAEFSKVTATLSDGRRLIDDESVDLVHVVLPHNQHARWAIEALRAGKHVICEKPAATRLEDFDAMMAASQAGSGRLLVVMNQLYNPVQRRVRELIDQGAIGRPFLSVENSFRNAGTNYRRADYWRNTVDQAGGGVLIDGGFHMVYRHLDALASAGSPEWVLADTAQLAVSSDGTPVAAKGEDFVSITVGFPGPLRIQWAHGWTLAADVERSRQSFLAGSEGTLELTDRAEEPIIVRRESGNTAERVDATPRSGTETTHVCLLDYLDALATAREPAWATLDLARLTLSTILSAYRSGQNGRKEPIR